VVHPFARTLLRRRAIRGSLIDGNALAGAGQSRGLRGGQARRCLVEVEPPPACLPRGGGWARCRSRRTVDRASAIVRSERRGDLAGPACAMVRWSTLGESALSAFGRPIAESCRSFSREDRCLQCRELGADRPRPAADTAVGSASSDATALIRGRAPRAWRSQHPLAVPPERGASSVSSAAWITSLRDGMARARLCRHRGQDHQRLCGVPRRTRGRGGGAHPADRATAARHRPARARTELRHQ
jgi:hypothetical protein